MEALGQDADDVEVKNTIFSMPPMKAPGIDGLHGIFFPSQWELVGPSMCKLVKQICFAGKVPAKSELTLAIVKTKIKIKIELSVFFINQFAVCSQPQMGSILRKFKDRADKRTLMVRNGATSTKRVDSVFSW
ncbi:hypothetical protein CUMW_179030 [Citrus unshiu]|uniref:Reverse transcriptase domain-containing protein n=1 Tax=Citrus unshiu TaxID=55188 RepID=A0A2H5PYD8_CITUN|nr:hypothetical protein CUMW_179030 [Citrus unshiu]